MDSKLKVALSNGGINEDTMEILQEEMVRSVDIFVVLKEEHFEKLLPKLKVGQHAQLLKIWEDYQVMNPKYNCYYYALVLKL